MNSKILFVFSSLIFLMMITGCGVKADPVKFQETAIDSYIQGYTSNEPTPEELERMKSSKAAAEAANKEEQNNVPSLIPNP